MLLLEENRIYMYTYNEYNKVNYCQPKTPGWLMIWRKPDNLRDDGSQHDTGTTAHYKWQPSTTAHDFSRGREMGKRGTKGKMRRKYI